MTPPAIVVACYNRSYSLKRLLDSLSNAHYPGNQKVTLVISIDLNDNKEVYKLCDDFEWKYGEKIVIRHDVHLGLKQHIIKCGDLSQQYDSVLILEDDLMVSPWFYEYALKASAYYGNEANIAGIALYSYRFTENNFFPFYPAEDGNDVYFMQLPCSWGKVFNARQWKSFRQWLEQNPVADKEILPPYIYNWSESSWKKHFTHYLIATGQYFVFPCYSLVTNFSEPGANSDRRGIFQVPLLNHFRDFKFAHLAESGSVYDTDFEILPQLLNKKFPAFAQYEYTVDMYGTKPLEEVKTPYLFSSKICSKPVLSFGNDLSRAMDNILYGTQGSFYCLGKTEDFITSKQEENNYYPEMNAIKDVAFNTYINRRIATEKYKVDYPRYHIVIDASANPLGLSDTIRSIQSQNYPHVKISVLADEAEPLVDGLEGVFVTKYNGAADFLTKLYTAVDTRNDYCCVLKSGDFLYPKALESVNRIFKRYPEIFWLSGVQTNKFLGEFTTDDFKTANLRWNKQMFQKWRANKKGPGIPASATFWRRDIWDSAKPLIQLTSAKNLTEDIWAAFFGKHFLHVTVLNVVASPSKNIANGQKTLLERNPFIAFWEFCFLKDFLFLRSVYKNSKKLVPVVRFDKASSSFYFNDY